MPARRDSDEMPDIYETMKGVFLNAVTAGSTHTRNCATLFSLHCDVVCRGVQMKYGEREGALDFTECFLHFLGQCLIMKEARPSDLGLRLVAIYVEYLNDTVGQIGHDYLQFYPQDYTDPGPSTPREMHEPAPWFTGCVLRFLKRALTSAKVQIRRRAIYTVSLMLGSLGEIDAQILTDVQSELRARLEDKDKTVRVHAATTLCKHMTSQDEPHLLEVMTCDPACVVRLAVVNHIPITARSLHRLLVRCRDDGRDEKSKMYGHPDDARVRSAVYRRLHENIAVKDRQQVPPRIPTHVDTFNASTIDKLLCYGLDDRDAAVQQETKRLIVRWADALDPEVKMEPGAASHEGADPLAPFKGLLALLTRLDLASSGSYLRVIETFLSARPKLCEELDLTGPAFWSDPTLSQLAFIRGLILHKGADAYLHDILPTVTDLAPRIEQCWRQVETKLADWGPIALDNADVHLASDEHVFWLHELLHICASVSSCDPYGSKMLASILCDMLRHRALPERLCEPVFAQLADAEGELSYVRIVREIIWCWLEESGCLNEDGHVNVWKLDDVTRMRCLRYYTLLCGYLPDRPSKEAIGLLQELSYKFVAKEAGRKGKAEGLAPATLFCLLHVVSAQLAAPSFLQELAEEAMEPTVKIELIRCVTDLFLKWGQKLQVQNTVTKELWTRRDWTNYWVHVLENTTDPGALATLAQALIKITWDWRELVDSRVMTKNLVVLYATHAMGDNQALVQPLQFFLKAYSHSCAVRQDVVREVFVDTYIYACDIYHEAPENYKSLSPVALLTHYLDWTNSSRVIRPTSGVNKTDDGVQLRLAIDIVYVLLGRRGSSEDHHTFACEADKRVLALMLPHLIFPKPEDIDIFQISSLELLLEKLLSHRYLKHQDSHKAIAVLKKRIQSRYKKQLESLSREEWWEIVELRALFEFLNASVPLSNEDEALKIEDEVRSKPNIGEKRPRFFYEGDEGDGNQDMDTCGTDMHKRPRLSESFKDVKESITMTDVTPSKQPSQNDACIYISSDESDAEDRSALPTDDNDFSMADAHDESQAHSPSFASPPESQSQSSFDEDLEDEKMVERSLRPTPEEISPSPRPALRNLSPAPVSPVSWPSSSPAPEAPLSPRPARGPIRESPFRIANVVPPLSDDEIENLGSTMGKTSSARVRIRGESGAGLGRPSSNIRRHVRRFSDIGDSSRASQRSDARRNAMPFGERRAEPRRGPPKRLEAPVADVDDSDPDIECIGYNPAPLCSITMEREDTLGPIRRNEAERQLLAKVEQDIYDLLS